MTSFLGIEHSATGRRWVGPSVEEERLAEAIAQSTRLPLPLCATLARRGVAPDQAAGFLAPTLRELLPDPLSLRDMGAAAARVLQAVRAGERIAIFADYDVDGGASAALLIGWLREIGRDSTLYIPDRIDEGYGPNEPAMEALARDHSLIVCVDCGTLSHGPVAAAKPADVIILDHHLGGETLPDALACVNPNRLDETGDLGHLCAASVVFLMLVEANRQMRAEGWKRLAVTSPNKACGKTTVSLNLALAMARQADLRVMLLDFDLRRPSLAGLMGQQGGAYDLAALLAGERDFSEHAVRFGPNLAIGLNRRAVPHSAEMLLAPSTASVLDEIESRFKPDVIIFDTAPMMGNDDNLAFLGQVDCALLVAAADSTSARQVDSSERDLSGLTNVLGTVMNKCRYLDERDGYGNEDY